VSKVACLKCGALILELTAQKNEGLCVPCKSGRRESIEATKRWHRKQVPILNEIKCAIGIHSWEDGVLNGQTSCEAIGRCCYCSTTNFEAIHDWSPWEPDYKNSCEHTKICKSCHATWFSTLHLWVENPSPKVLRKCTKCGLTEYEADSMC